MSDNKNDLVGPFRMHSGHSSVAVRTGSFVLSEFARVAVDRACQCRGRQQSTTKIQTIVNVVKAAKFVKATKVMNAAKVMNTSNAVNSANEIRRETMMLRAVDKRSFRPGFPVDEVARSDRTPTVPANRVQGPGCTRVALGPWLHACRSALGRTRVPHSAHGRTRVPQFAERTPRRCHPRRTRPGRPGRVRLGRGGGGRPAGRRPGPSVRGWERGTGGRDGVAHPGCALRHPEVRHVDHRMWLA
jgi:hypothetical protein